MTSRIKRRVFTEPGRKTVVLDVAQADADLHNKIVQSFAENDAQTAMSADIDAILKRLDNGIPRLDARLDQLLERQRRPLTV